MKFSHSFAFVFFVAGAVLCAPAQADSTIVIIRHGEKPALGLGQLNCRGLNRSLALPALLLSRYGKPTAIYAPNPAQPKIDKGVAYAYVRPLATVEPLAIRSGLPVELRWGMKEIEPLAEHLLAAPSGTQVVAWEHHWGETLARHLIALLGGKAEEIPAWADDDFDSAYVIRFGVADDGARYARFTREAEGLDNLPENCVDVPSPGAAPDALPHR